jgi:N-acetyl-alpha-D-glucosaminyl L-malate synthase BshA
VKRTQDVIQIFYRVRKEVPSKLLLVGDGPERQHLEVLSRELNISEDVRFLGKQDPVEELLAVSDLFLMPSETESFGLAALEAMACQVPVIASDTGGIPEIMVHGVTGFMSKVGDVDDMAKHAVMLLSDEELLDKYKHQALDHAKKYDIETVLPVYEAFYNKVVQQQFAGA